MATSLQRRPKLLSSNEVELLNMLATSIAYDEGPSCLRYPRGNGRNVELAGSGVDPVTLKGTPLEIGKGVVRREGKDVVLLAYGESVNQAMAAAENLQATHGVSATVVDARFCKPLDEELIRRVVKEHPAMVIVEEGAVGGFGSHVLHFMAHQGLLDGGIKVRPMCLPDRWIDHGSQKEQWAWAGIDASAIEATALSLMGKKVLA